MEENKLHTSFLENEFGPINIGILKQENNLRIVHLYDRQSISRTVGIVQFIETDKEVIRKAHQRILNGDPLGNTLLQSDIDFEKRTIQKFMVRLPDWLLEDFRTTEEKTMVIHSRIDIMEEGSEESFQYAEILEIIPPDILYLFQPNGELNTGSNKDVSALLNFANISNT